MHTVKLVLGAVGSFPPLDARRVRFLASSAIPASIARQDLDDRTGPVTVAAIASAHESAQGRAHRVQIGDLRLDHAQLAVRQRPRVGAAIRAIQPQQTGDFFERETERLRA